MNMTESDKKNNWVWNYFTKLENTEFQAECNLCSKHFLYCKTHMVSSHFKVKHSNIKRHRNTYWVWSHFEKFATKKQCKYHECGFKQFSQNTSITSLKYHLKSIHDILPNEEDLFLKSFMWKHITKLNDWQVTCNKCHATLDLHLSSYLSKHLLQKHKMIINAEEINIDEEEE